MRVWARMRVRLRGRDRVGAGVPEGVGAHCAYVCMWTYVRACVRGARECASARV